MFAFGVGVALACRGAFIDPCTDTVVVPTGVDVGIRCRCTNQGLCGRAVVVVVGCRVMWVLLCVSVGTAVLSGSSGAGMSCGFAVMVMLLLLPLLLLLRGCS